MTGTSKSRTWFPSINGDNPYRHVLVNQLKSYKLGVREIWVGQDDDIMYKEYGLANDNAVEDGKNVRQTYRLVKLSEIRGFIRKVDI